MMKLEREDGHGRRMHSECIKRDTLILHLNGTLRDRGSGDNPEKFGNQ